MSRSVSYGIVIGGALLFLLCACVAQGQPAAEGTGVPIASKTTVPTPTKLPIPTHASLPGPSPSTEPTSEPSPHTQAVTNPDPSGARGGTTTEASPPAADLEIQVPDSVLVVPGETTSYTLTIHNHGPDPATDVVLTGLLPIGVNPIWTQPAQPLCGRQERNVKCDVGILRGGDKASVALDLSIGGTETTITGTQLAGVTLASSAPTCAIGQDLAQPQVTCHLATLQPGAETQMRIAVDVDASITGTLAHTATITGHEVDANQSNNRSIAALTVGAVGPVSVTTVPTTTDLIVQANGPSRIVAGQPFTYTYTITNRGTLAASGVRFEDAVPSDMNLIAYAPGPPLCEQEGDLFTCYLRDLDSGETVTFTLHITGHGELPMKIGLDPLMPGWPICSVLKESTWLHIVQCELGGLKPGQATRVQLVLSAIGVLERTTANTVSVSANEAELNSVDNTITTTMAVYVEADLLVWSEISGPASPGKTLSYTLTVANLGPSDADDVILTDTLPLGASSISAIPGEGDECRIEQADASEEGQSKGSMQTGGSGRTEGSGRTSGSHIICSLGRLSSGRATSVTIIVEVDESLALASAETITHSARVMAKPADPDPRNNELTDSIPVSVGGEE